MIESYDSADLRFQYYFQTNADGNHRLTGHHTGSSTYFGGLTVGENLLIASESNLRLGDESKAKSFLKELLSLRYEDDSYSEILDQEDKWAKSIQRDVGGEIYQLTPMSPAYVFPIPDQEILRSGIEQNQR